MALTITSTYAGEFSGKYIAAALLSGSTIENGGIEVMPNIKYKSVIQKVATTGLIGDSTCDFTNAGNVTLTERIIEPLEFQINLELCKTPFIANWESASMGYSAFDTLPPTFAEFLIAHVAAEVAAATENNIWQGNLGGAAAGEFNGFTTLMAADADVIDVAAVAGGVDAANVIAELGKIVDAIPSTLYGKDDMYLYVSQNFARAYVRSLGGFGAAGLGANGTNNEGTQWWNNGALSFDGVKIFVAQGLPDNYAVAAQKSNLYFGCGLLSDQNLVKTLDMSDLDGSQNVRIIMRYACSVQYGIGSDCVLYS